MPALWLKFSGKLSQQSAEADRQELTGEPLTFRADTAGDSKTPS
jgi:hypothetical protein